MMNDDYLWDRTGEPDAELAQLERVLGTLRLAPSERSLASMHPAPVLHATARRLATAAAFMLLAGIFLIAYKLHNSGPLTSWMLSLSGAQSTPARVGQVIETAESTRATLTSEFVGRVDIAPRSRLRLMVATTKQQRLTLDHGSIHAFIWAPPAQFVVDTPAAKAVDLGCQYTLQVDKHGVGLLRVEMGWVAFDWRGTESFIPAGAACRTRPGHGPDTPYFLDASPEFKHATAEFDMNGSQQALSTALASARKRDALTLWHLLQRAPPNERGEVFDRLAELVKLPPDLSREAVLHGDRRSIDSIWNALDLGDTSWWREWKREW